MRDPEPDPTRLFRSLKGENPPEEFWTGFWPSVRAGIREAELRHEFTITRSRALLLGSSAGVMAAAAVLAVAFLVVPIPRGPLPGGLPAAAVASGAVPGGDAAPPPVLEDLQSADARVYTFHVGTKTDATDVILIVDEAIDI